MVHIIRTLRARLCGVLADVLVNIYPSKFTDKVDLEGGQKVIYVVLKNSLYGALIASLLFWIDLSGALRSWVFDTNPYEICVMNNTVGGKQCIICCQVENINISHVIPEVLDKVLSQLTT